MSSCRGVSRDYPPWPRLRVGSSSHRWVCSSVHPGTAYPLRKAGAVTACSGCKWCAVGLECRTVAASADAQKMLKALKAKIDRIATPPRNSRRKTILSTSYAKRPGRDAGDCRVGDHGYYLPNCEFCGGQD